MEYQALYILFGCPCMYVCMYVFYIHTHTHTHTHIYIYPKHRVFMRLRKIAKNVYQLRHACLLLCLSAWNNSHLMFFFFRKSTNQIQVSLKSGNNNVYFALRPMSIYDIISLNSSQNEKCFSLNLQRKLKHILHSITFAEDRTVYEIMWENTVEPNRPQITIQYGACALHAG